MTWNEATLRRCLALATLAAMLAVMPAIGTAWAHAGDEVAPTQTLAPPAPRGEARGDGIEATAVASADRRLFVYLDREDTNEPVAGAAVEVESDGIALKLVEGQGGVYVADGWIPSPGRNRLTVSYQLPDSRGKLDVQIDAPFVRAVAAPLPMGSRADMTSVSAVFALAGVLYLALTAVFFMRSREILRARALQAVRITNVLRAPVSALKNLAAGRKFRSRS